MNVPAISIVTTMYHSQEYINQFYRRSLAQLKSLGIDDYEFIFVDDGSPDNSLAIAKELIIQDSSVRVVELSQNYGHNKAIMAGLEASVGQYVFLIDLDLEEPPELLEQFWQRMYDPTKNDVDVLFGVQKTRKGGLAERFSGDWYYKIFNLLSDDVSIPENVSTVRLMKKEVVTQLLNFKEHEFYFGAACAQVGYQQEAIYFQKKSSSPTTYPFFKKYNLFINSIFSYSKKPLYLIFYTGFLITLFSFAFGTYMIIRKLFYGAVLDGWTGIMVSIWFFSGTIILFLGVIAIYLSKMFSQTKHHPFVVVKTIHGKKR